MFSREQLEILKPFEKYFDTAVHHQYCRCPLRSELALIDKVYKEATGWKGHVNASCQQCLFNFINEVGKLYYASQETKPAKKKTVKSKK